MTKFPRTALGFCSILLAATAALVAVDITLAIAQPAGQPGARPPAGRPAQAQPAAAQPAAPAQPPAAQPGPGQAAPGQATGNATVSGWVTRCISQGRKAATDCVAEQSLTAVRTGQIVLIVSVRVPAEGQPARLSARMPVGLLLTAGAKLRVDSGTAVDLPIQTCDAQGCYGGLQLPPELLNTMRTAKQLEVQVQMASAENFTLSMPLEGFAAAHDRVK